MEVRSGVLWICGAPPLHKTQAWASRQLLKCRTQAEGGLEWVTAAFGRVKNLELTQFPKAATPSPKPEASFGQTKKRTLSKQRPLSVEPAVAD